MKLFFYGLTIFALVEGQVRKSNERNLAPAPGKVKKYQKGLQICAIGGGYRGQPFEDTDSISAGQALTAIKLCSGERLDVIGVTIVSKTNEQQDLFHGSEKNCKVHTLASNEHIVSYEVHLANVHFTPKRRIGTSNSTTKTVVSMKPANIGQESDNFFSCAASDRYKLAGFCGRSGAEVDAVNAFWTPIKDP